MENKDEGKIDYYLLEREAWIDKCITLPCGRHAALQKAKLLHTQKDRQMQYCVCLHMINRNKTRTHIISEST